METRENRILIIGVGNLIMSDDGAGIHVIRELHKIKGLPSKEISLLEAGTSPLYYLEEISRAETLIVVDAIRGGENAGSIYCFNYCFKEKDLNINLNPVGNLHGCSILQVVLLARELTKLPTKVIIYGIEPKNIDPGEGLSESVKDALPKLVELIREELI